MQFRNMLGYLQVWLVGVVVCSLLHLPEKLIVLGSVLYVGCILLLRRHVVAYWAGLLLQGIFKRPGVAFRLYEYAYGHGVAAAQPMLAHGMLLLEKSCYKKALAVLEKAHKLPISAAMQVIALQDLALARQKNGDVAGAIEIMEKLRQENECFQSDFYLTLAYFYITAGDYAAAQTVNELAKQPDGDNSGYYDNLGMIFYYSKDYEKATEAFQTALEANPELVSSRYFLGLVAEQTGQPKLAAEQFAQLSNATFSGLSIVSKQEVQQKYRQYFGSEESAGNENGHE